VAWPLKKSSVLMAASFGELFDGFADKGLIGDAEDEPHVF
jgi:hypothetical protein